MPVEFTQYPPPENTGVFGDTLFRLTVAYDGTGRRISKTRWVKARGDADWSRGHVTHYTGIGTEVRENLAAAQPETQVVVNMPQGLGRYGIENADHVAENGSAQTFEWYLKNHLGSTMLVYGTGGTTGGLKAAYDYRSFGEQITLTAPPTGKVTENFTGKERDDETELNYFGARYLDPMLGMWISVDPMRQFVSPYLYAGNGYNPVNVVDPDGNYSITQVDDKYAGEIGKYHYHYASLFETGFYKVYDLFIPGGGFMTSSKPDCEIENSLRPSVSGGLFGAILDALTFIPFLKPASVPLSASEKTLKEVKNFNDLYSIITLDNFLFEDFMNQLTSQNGIYGSSVEDVKAKANWANAYGRKLYDNGVREVTDEMRQQFGDAYKKEFMPSDE